MPSRKSHKRTRCLECGVLAETTVLGRCPRCVSIDTALQTGWTPAMSLTRFVTRSDRVQLGLMISSDGSTWRLSAFETRPDGTQCHAQITRLPELVDVVREADLFARRWLEKAPGTSIATFGQRPPS